MSAGAFRGESKYPLGKMVAFALEGDIALVKPIPHDYDGRIVCASSAWEC